MSFLTLIFNFNGISLGDLNFSEVSPSLIIVVIFLEGVSIIIFGLIIGAFSDNSLVVGPVGASLFAGSFVVGLFLSFFLILFFFAEILRG